VLLGAATTALLVTVCLPAAASTQDNISILSAGPADGNPDQLIVTAADANELPASVTVDFCPASVSTCSDSAAVLQLAMQAESQSNTDDQTFDLTIPEGQSQGELPPGTYSMAFDATDVDETDPGLTAQDQADLAFLYTTTITGAAATSYPGTSATISGQVTGVPPGSSSPVPLSDVPVYLSTSSEPVATTDSDGEYSAQVTLAAGTTEYSVDVQQSQTWGSAAASVPLSRSIDRSRLSAQVSPEDFVYGSKVKATLTGTASYQSNGAWQPLSDYQIQVTVGSKKISVTTQASGQFSLTYPPSDGTTWSVQVGDGVLLSEATANGQIHVAVPLSFRSFSTSWAPANSITVSGCVDVTVPGFAAPDGSVEVQYARGRYGPWKVLSWSWLTVSGNPSCRGDDRSYFTITKHVPASNAYYRAYVPGTLNYLSKLSHSLYRWKYITQISSPDVAPRAVAKNGKITVSGRLQVWLRNAFRDYGKQTVGIVTLPPGATAWIWLKSIKTSAKGAFKGTTKDPHGWSNGALVSVYYLGNSTHFASVGVPAACIHVTGEPNLCGRDDDLGAVTDLNVRPPA
jgi:hypothetical protein